MSRLEELINQHCPDGVEYKKIGEICDTCTDYTAAGSFADIAKNVKYKTIPDHALLVRTMDIKSKFTKGKPVYINEHAFEYLWRVRLDKPCIVMPNIGNCGEIYYITPKEIPYKNSALAPNAILLNTSTENLKFISYMLQADEFQKKLRKIVSPVGQTKFNKTELKLLEIPVPPLPVQEEIVRILDRITELETELETELDSELALRQKQYVHYLDKIMSFEDYEGEVDWKPLKDIATNWFRGNGIKREEITETGMPCIRYGEIYTTYGIHFATCVSHTPVGVMNNPKIAKKGTILFAITGESVEDIATSTAYLGEEDILVGGDILAMEHEQDAKFLAYALSTTSARLQKAKGRIKSKVVHSNKNDISEIIIPIPADINEQKRIAERLDRLNTLINNIPVVLRTEINMRHQEYNYFRQKLLTFK